jgi:hypothetical protein
MDEIVQMRGVGQSEIFCQPIEIPQPGSCHPTPDPSVVASCTLPPPSKSQSQTTTAATKEAARETNKTGASPHSPSLRAAVGGSKAKGEGGTDGRKSAAFEVGTARHCLGDGTSMETLLG